ncbi:MAG: Mut7-C RNAse domain-containing protein [Dehalococcoidia bacterium]|nr:Mut7-C RNAse domain-containing protein [Dehalococcoidia bacterium]
MPADIHVTVRCYAELNDFLPLASRGVDIECAVDRTSVKDLVERLGVPHTEVDLLLVNGEPVSFDRIVHDGDRVSAYPVFESFDITGVSLVRPQPLRDLRFVADGHLGKLARLLRFLGLDTKYEAAPGDDELAAIAAAEQRVLLTRDRGLLKRAAVERGYCVRSDDPESQLAEVIQRFDLASLARPFSRCPACNTVLEHVSRAEVLHRLPPLVRQYYHDFRRCPGCDRVYWPGTHHEHVSELLNRVVDRSGARAR